MNVGEKIKFLRTRKGMTQKELGKQVGLSPASIQSYEVGRTSPKPDVLDKISKTLEVNYLFWQFEKMDESFESIDLDRNFFFLGYDLGIKKLNQYMAERITPLDGKPAPIDALSYLKEQNPFLGEEPNIWPLFACLDDDKKDYIFEYTLQFLEPKEKKEVMKQILLLEDD